VVHRRHARRSSNVFQRRCAANRRRGHPVRTVGDLEGPCSVEIIRRDATIGMLLAGSDLRRDGWAVAS
jgi:hypothetical protein